jgi:membrane-associated phospholipid phosphatase
MDIATNLLRRHAWSFGVPLVALLCIALLLLTDGNIALFYFLNRAMAPAGNWLWSNLTLLGDSTIAILFILPLLGRKPEWVWQFMLAALLATLLVHGIKGPLSADRPPLVLTAGSFNLIGPEYQHNSFPSGHTTTIFLVAGFFCLQQISNWIRSGLLLLAILVGLSRIACGVHWPLDVLGGAFAGWVSAWSGIWLGQRWRLGLNVWAQRIFAVLATGIALWCLWSYDNAYPGTQLLQYIVAGLTLALSLPGQVRLFNFWKKP